MQKVIEIFRRFSYVLPLKSAFLCDCEDAHNAAIYLVKNNYAPRYREETRGIYHNVDTSSAIYYKNPTGGKTSKYRLKFPNCIGLAAGFDKHGEVSI